ncbi:hypothetical protein [Mucilaginibacter myungsuensis]|uniref:Uncharacterized protein n=1 Tax=Mucilaginibacter myungsuensis TaxID=649104 RepID=A0A929KYZ1_9SPHI|nr:hypothetical protein [Mucilaginibacter myungsuensis]MBE9661454.1 hypothetical protein [Mucilaginibacter myungsuensis]MDN3597597.1 hypothetical protein [Mucilaginibacter myungsuensis]
MKPKTLTTLLIAAATLAVALTASAQKLPSEQKVSFYAPADIKIDGKPTEWTGKYQAKNSATLLTYVMSNDEENLYLAIQADQTPAIGKIFFGGISLVVKSKKDKAIAPVKITYPLVTTDERLGIISPLKDKDQNADAAATATNDLLGKAAKTINIAGLIEVADPDISVYNDLGIKAAAQADNTRTMTFEYKLPLKFIKHLMDESSAFDYSIIVNGGELKRAGVSVGAPITGSGSPTGGGGGGMVILAGAPVGDMFSPTDLKASYKLASK